MATTNVIYAAHRFGLKSKRRSTVRPKVNNPTEKTSTSTVAIVSEVKPRKSRRAHQYWLSKGINPHSADFDEKVDALIRSYYKGGDNMRLREETTSVLRGIHVVKFRLDKGLSVKKFAELVGYSNTGIAVAEKESSKHISLRLENAIRKAFYLDDNDIQALLNGITEKRPPGIKLEYNPSWSGRLERVSSQSRRKTIIRRRYVDIIESGALDTAPDDGLSIPELKMLLDAVAPLLERRRAQ